MMTNTSPELSHEEEKESASDLRFPLSPDLYERAKRELKLELEKEQQELNKKNKGKNDPFHSTNTDNMARDQKPATGLVLKMKPVFINGYYSARN